jgi:hypothetical protein
LVSPGPAYSQCHAGGRTPWDSFGSWIAFANKFFARIGEPRGENRPAAGRHTWSDRSVSGVRGRENIFPGKLHGGFPGTTRPLPARRCPDPMPTRSCWPTSISSFTRSASPASRWRAAMASRISSTTFSRSVARRTACSPATFARWTSASRISSRLSRRDGARPAPARHHARARPPRPGPRPLAAARPRRVPQQHPRLAPRAPGRAAQSAQRPPHHAGHLSRHRGRSADPRRQEGRAHRRLRPAAGRGAQRRPPSCSASLHRLRARPGGVLRFAAPAPGRRAGGAGLHPDAAMETRFFVPGALVANLDFVESIFGNAGDPHLPENDAGARSRALDRPHRLHHPRAAPQRPDQTRTRPAAPRRGHRPPAPRRHVLAIPGRALQRGRGLQDHRPQRRRRDRHADFRQLFRLLQKRGEDPDQFRRQPARPRRGGARRGRHRFPQLRRGRGFPAQPEPARREAHLRGGARPARRPGRTPARRLGARPRGP